MTTADLTLAPPPPFWGKWRDGLHLPLAAHCLDVALVFRGLTQLTGQRRALEATAGGPLTDAQCDRLAVLAGIHDVGKVNWGFQEQWKNPRVGHVECFAPLLHLYHPDPVLHGRFTAVLPPELAHWWATDAALGHGICAALSHHGTPFDRLSSPDSLVDAQRGWQTNPAGRDPMQGVATIFQWLRTAFPAAFAPGGPPLSDNPAFQHTVAGLITLADWLGSHTTWFPLEDTTCAARLAADRRAVPRLLDAVGLDAAPHRAALADAPSFAERFHQPPRPLQALMDALPLDESTRLLVAEAETGSGKTEAALNWFWRLYQAGAVDSLYFALPTRVAAHDVYTRVAARIADWFPDPRRRPTVLLAVPGVPQPAAPPADILLPEEAQVDPDPSGARWRWAADHPKRFLAAGIAVGTIDQALLSILQWRHAHLRGACLQRSLLVVDEVHSSDAYMGRLLEHLLARHRRVGGHALLLSATLGLVDRARYLRTGAGPSVAPPSLADATAAPYPAVTLATGVSCPVAPVSAASKVVQITTHPTASDPTSLIPLLHAALTRGARVLVVMNTVRRAIELLRAAEASRLIPEAHLFAYRGVVVPHHGRFAPADRHLLDAAVTQRFGVGSAPGPCLLIGTQTLEQSLDIDADCLVTDLAPADVLLQRMGRLHRHPRARPPGFETPQCHVLLPDADLSTMLTGPALRRAHSLGYGTAYEDLRSLELTRRLLLAHSTLTLPAANRSWVEATTHPEALAQLTSATWDPYQQEQAGAESMKRRMAAFHLLPFTASFGEYTFHFDPASPATTRLGLNTYDVAVTPAFDSPLGARVTRLLIPGHMAPRNEDDVKHGATVVAAGPETTLALGSWRYTYSRYGLEVHRAQSAHGPGVSGSHGRRRDPPVPARPAGGVWERRRG